MQLIKSTLLLSLLTTASYAQDAGDIVSKTLFIKSKNNTDIAYEIPLMEGPWVIENSSSRELGSNKIIMKDIRLYQVNEGKLHAALEISAKIDGQPTKWNDEPCKLSLTLHKNNFDTGLWRQKCLTIAPINYLQVSNATTEKIIKEYSDKGIKHDYNAILSTYTRFDDGYKFLKVRNIFFPSSYGLDNPLTTIINSSPYHPSRIQTNPEKKEFLEQLIKNQEINSSAYDASFEKKPIVSIENFSWKKSPAN